MHEPQADLAGGPRSAGAPPAPVLSVVLVTKDDDDRVAETVWSVLHQSLAELELVVVDRGSVDDTPDILEAAASDSRLRRVDAATLSRGAARDLGLARSRGTYVMFADADGTLPEHACAAAVARARRTGAELVVGRHVRFTPRRLTTSAVPAVARDRACWNRLVDRAAWNTAGLTFAGTEHADDLLVALRADLTLRREVLDEPVQIRRARVGRTRPERAARVRDHLTQELACLAEVRDRQDPALLDAYLSGVLDADLWSHLPALLEPDALTDPGLDTAREAAATLVRAAPPAVWRRLPADRLRVYTPLGHGRWTRAAASLTARPRPTTLAGRVRARADRAALAAAGATEALVRGALRGRSAGGSGGAAS
ncbi:glycosyltransferase family 2 protein [Myceligenerans xiligouense]|uniref:Glycosyltransferase involved in cell wall biosynthesis n=1 Tax=Myceligenerans xiligouense TaxID=253184 RepID=A0A3N4YH41_9MICO|nr:glycosyltransferase family 2 protein [Myceligenerans xiligouense]RPF20123.1 glycosyltransferase involved in cell wall biosynthesis [Myceligenerans xiligouense]